MKRNEIVKRIGEQFLTTNIENGEFSYISEAGSKENLIKILPYEPKHFFLDLRFEKNGVVVLVETKQEFNKADEKQLKEYLDEEKALHPDNRIIAILANTNNDTIKVWKSSIDKKHLLSCEITIDTMEHYESLFKVNKQNDREKVLKNTYLLNETLHKKDIDEKLRSQFVGTALLYIRNVLNRLGITKIDDKTREILKKHWLSLSSKQIRAGISETLDKLLDGSDNKNLKIEILEKNVLDDQKVKNLEISDWISILDEIVANIYKYINADSSEGQDILNLFFIAFNKYTGKADKNQAFTPDHITNFMCRICGVDRTKRLFDGTCGSGSFLVQGMVLELADLNRQKLTEEEKKKLREKITKENVYGIEIEEKAFGLATTNMLIHGDGNTNIVKANLFLSEEFLRKADPDIILMNPPYNAKPINITKEYKSNWKKDAKEDPTKGLVFLKFISDVIKKMNEERVKKSQSVKEVKVAILLPVSVAIGNSSFISQMKAELLLENTLEAVFTLPNEIFYPGASASACCMLWTLGKSHTNSDGTVNKTFFGYFKEDGHKKKKNLGRIEQFDKNNQSFWKKIEEEWLDLYRNKIIKDGLSAMQVVNGDDEWLCEAYMKTDYSKLSETDFQRTINNYCSYLVKAGKFPNLTKKVSQTSKINISEWKEFLVEKILDCSSTQFSIRDDLTDGNIPFVSRTAENNGIDGYVDVEIDKLTSGNCITIGAEGIYSFYQPETFATGNKIYQIRNPNMNKYIGLFLSTILNLGNYRYSYGRARIMSKLKKEIIKLPVDKNGSPDWQFMENYIKSLPYGDRI